MSCILLSGNYICYVGVITVGLSLVDLTNADSEWEMSFNLHLRLYPII